MITGNQGKKEIFTKQFNQGMDHWLWYIKAHMAQKQATRQLLN